MERIGEPIGEPIGELIWELIVGQRADALSSGGAVSFLSSELPSPRAAALPSICARVQTGQSGRGPRLIKHGIDPVLLVRGKVGVHTRDTETDRRLI